ncbi:hypothetical protein CC80DRAFT_546556 [Byssothecium circinans]|uniref:Uncharacterized protein n=1 Tax=Byssothecium circinans TaxID=147558 RepID=A0A6A5U0C7_9PLEO|nr:hypothetical protein CC80DRAFT_546556 [Byssothecium circinans]
MDGDHDKRSVTTGSTSNEPSIILNHDLDLTPDEDHILNQKKLEWADTRIHGLRLESAQLVTENERLQRQRESCVAETARIAGERDGLFKRVTQLELERTELDRKHSSATQELLFANAKIEEANRELVNLRAQVEQLSADNERMARNFGNESGSSSPTDSVQGRSSYDQRIEPKEHSRIHKLDDPNMRLVEMVREDSAKIATVTSELRSADAAKAQLRREKAQLNQENGQLIQANAQLTQANFQLSQEKNIITEERNRIEEGKDQLEIDLNDARGQIGTLRPQNQNLWTENSDLREVISSLRTQFAAPANAVNPPQAQSGQASDLFRNVAYKLNQFDLADEAFRVFDCKHPGGYGTIQVGGLNSTQKKATWKIMDELFFLLQGNVSFMKAYESNRQSIIRHHKAHERISQGRGDHSGKVRARFATDDERRGINIAYN